MNWTGPMGTGASSSAAALPTSLKAARKLAGNSGDRGAGDQKKSGKRDKDFRGERYIVEVDFIAPPENRRLSNEMANVAE